MKIAAMNGRSLQQDVAQMVMPRIDGAALEDPQIFRNASALVEEGVGGFILFGGSVEKTPRRLQELQQNAAIPLLIASDVERGLGQQLVGATRFPSQRAVASAINRRSPKDGALLDRMLDAVRSETRAAGIHVVFSPVVDVNNNPQNPIICTRAFGDDPGTVAWFGTRYIARLQKPSGRGRIDVLACAKHFPGHGDTDQDSHVVLPVIRADRQRLNRVELPPFREAVQDGVGMIMIAHLLVPALDPEHPVTFSQKAVTALLREGMAFDGLIVSDALDMGALTHSFTADEIAVQAVQAGIDNLLHPADARATIDAVVAAVEQGRLTRRRIAESVERIRAAKKRLGLFDARKKEPAPIDYRKHARLADAIARKAPRVLSDPRQVLPLTTQSGISCFILDDDNNTDSGNAFIHAMREQFSNCSVVVLTPDSEIPESFVFDGIRASEYTILAFFSRVVAAKGSSGLTDRLRATAERLLAEVRASGGISVLLSFDSPYLLDQFRNADARVAAYDRLAAVQYAAGALLAGK